MKFKKIILDPNLLWKREAERFSVLLFPKFMEYDIDIEQHALGFADDMSVTIRNIGTEICRNISFNVSHKKEGVRVDFDSLPGYETQEYSDGATGPELEALGYGTKCQIQNFDLSKLDDPIIVQKFIQFLENGIVSDIDNNLKPKKTDNKKRLIAIQNFLRSIEFGKKIPDFIGAWSSKEKMNSFDGIINGSYMLGYLVDEKSSTVVDALGISTLDNPFTTDSFLVQNYFEEQAYEENAREELRYYPNLAARKRDFPEKFPIFAVWEGDMVTGQFHIVGEEVPGYFLLIQNDDSQQFVESSELIRKELSIKLMV